MNAQDPSSIGKNDLEIYQQRWQSLDATISALADHYAKLDFPRKNTILHLLKSLRAFGAGQFNFFYYGFLEQSDPDRLESDPRLAPSAKFPVPYLLDTVLLQIGHDLEGIQRAADQRIPIARQTRETLQYADKLAWDAIKPAIDYGVTGEATTVLTYFQKSADIRVIPYAQVALIGIPFSCVDNPLDFLAIPHEAGHYVFRHPSATVMEEKKSIIKEVKNLEQTFQNWTEEIFADTYGSLIAGPVIALDFQYQALQHQESQFIKDDGEHPTPILRPFIYLRVFSGLLNGFIPDGEKDAWQALITELRTNWKNKLDSLGVKEEFAVSTTTQQSNSSTTTTTSLVPIDTAITLSDAEISTADTKPLDTVVNEAVQIILARIQAYIQARKLPQYSRALTGWAGDITADTHVETLFSQYQKNFKSLVLGGKLLPPEADPDAVAEPIWDPEHHYSQLWIDWVKEPDKGFNGVWPPLQGPIPNHDDAVPGDPDPGTWRYILFANGWNTEGPCSVGSRP